MIRAKMAELRYIVVSGGPFCSFSNLVLRSGAYEYLYGNFREGRSFIGKVSTAQTASWESPPHVH